MSELKKPISRPIPLKDKHWMVERRKKNELQLEIDPIEKLMVDKAVQTDEKIYKYILSSPIP
jgi:hypothetical protein